MYDQRPCEEFRSWREFLDDYLTGLLMHADGVSRESLRSILSRAAQALAMSGAAGLLVESRHGICAA